MSVHYHAVVWIDHVKARIIYFNATESEKTDILAEDQTVKIHHHARTVGVGHEAEDREFLQQVVDNLKKAKAVLITGPAHAKLALSQFIERHEPALAGRIAGVEPQDHPSDGELLSYARAFFHAKDRMTPQKV